MGNMRSEMAERDVASLFHGQTNARRLEQEGPLVIVRGEGIHVYDDSGKEYIDTLASMWNAGLGFSEKRLIAAASRQFEALPVFHSYYQRSHPPAIELASRLTSMAPGEMTKAFFTNSGSEAVETAVKLVRFFNNALGRSTKKKVIARTKAYHGAGIFSGSLTGLSAIHSGFDLPEAGILRVESPHYIAGRNNLSEESYAESMARDLEAVIVQEGPDSIAAMIAEPIIGSGGVIPPPHTYWEKVQNILRKYDILLIADEVISGFGRTGFMFACELYDIRPDLLVLSKQITSGYAALGAVLFGDKLYQPIADQTARLGTFGHAFTSGSHPVATAVANETLNLIEERHLVAHVRGLAPHFQERLTRVSQFKSVQEVRAVGLLGAVDFVDQDPDISGKLARRAVELGPDYGLLLRMSGSSIVLCPPMIITAREIDTMFDRLEASIEAVERAF